MKKKMLLRRLKIVLVFLLILLSGVGIGIACGLLGGGDTSAVWTAVFIYGAIFVQLILHEGGHLIGGLLSGYRFESFRIGGVLLTRMNGKLRLRWMPIAGTGGQCLLLPPDCAPEDAPFRLYHAAGSAANLITALLHIPLLFSASGIVRVYAFCMLASGLYFGILNGVPMRVGGIDNDGMNIRMMQSDPALRRVIIHQLKINAAASSGQRLRDMPKEWFFVGEHKRLHGAMYMNYLMDQGAYEEALSYGRQLVCCKGLNRIHMGAVQSDVESLKLLLGQLVGAESDLIKKFRKSMAYDASVQRALFIRALLHEGDQAAAEKIHAQFERAARRTASPGSIPMEYELIAAAREKYQSDHSKQTEGA